MGKLIELLLNWLKNAFFGEGEPPNTTAPSVPARPVTTLTVKMTRYFLAELTDRSSWRDWKGVGDVKVMVKGLGERTWPGRFVAALKGEGSGIIPEGVVQYDAEQNTILLLDPLKYPYGMGAKGNSLVPFVSVAVDPTLVKLGTRCILPALRDLKLPTGATHNGIVSADDTGGAIKGNHIDWFVARASWNKKLDTVLPDQVELYWEPE